ncbi:MAG: BatA domain-containing protein [Mucilaginibacter sp.]|nr:BatA domain-containing protein [Mucilaginibacter sp.]
MQFLSPIWFLGLSALTIPLVIHLWNVKPGKTLKVGSISLITEASKTSSRSFKLLDILLLILRCVLLALIATFLSNPFWENHTSVTKSKGWVLIPRENFRETYAKFKPRVDSLIGKGYEVHYFNKDFVKWDSTKHTLDTASNLNYWNVVKQLDKVGLGRQVYIFTPNLQKHFKGNKPDVGLNLTWQTYTPADSVSKWIASAAFTNDGGIKVTDGSSAPQSTSYHSKILKSDGDAVHTVRIQNGRTSISLKNSNATPVIVDATTQNIAIFIDNYPLDAKYLKAALDAATAFNGKKTIIKQYSNLTIPGNQTWLFWLSDKPAPAALAKSAKYVFAYADGKPADVNSWIDPGHIVLTKRILSKQNAQAIWTDGFGDALLTQQGGVFRFYSHFNSAWGDLVWSEDFPAMILKLLQQKHASQPNRHDRRILSNQQLQPNIIKLSTPISPSRESGQTDVSGYFWLLLMVFFAAERILNYNIKQRENG